MSRKLIIDGNAVYEIDEDCMLKKMLNRKENKEKDPGRAECLKKRTETNRYSGQ